MKKTTILLTLTLCACTLNGMEPEKPQTVNFGEEWNTLPDDLKPLILAAFSQSGNDLDTAIKNIVNASAINMKLYKIINLSDFQGFTKIVHELANKFKVSSQEVANKFNTPTSTKYKGLLWEANFYAGEPAGQRIDDEINKLINIGLDVNAIYLDGKSLLQRAILEHRGLELVKSLLNNNANYLYKDKEGNTALDHAKKLYSEVGETAPDKYLYNLRRPVLEQIILVLEEKESSFVGTSTI